MKPLALTVAFFAFAALADAKNVYVPVAGTTEGAQNTRFRTDVRIFNPSPIETIRISVHFLPQGMDGSNISGILVPVGPGEMVVLNDIASTLFQLPPPVLGALRFDSDVAPLSYPFTVTSRIYTDSPNPAVTGTYGQFVPALDPERDAHLISIVLHVSHSNDLSRGSRTNAGIMNPNRVPAVVIPTLVRADVVFPFELHWTRGLLVSTERFFQLGQGFFVMRGQVDAMCQPIPHSAGAEEGLGDFPIQPVAGGGKTTSAREDREPQGRGHHLRHGTRSGEILQQAVETLFRLIQ